MKSNLSLAVAGAALVVACVFSVASARTDSPEWSLCKDSQGAFSVDDRLKFCTTTIQSGQLSERELASAYISRAIIHARKGEWDAAILDDEQAIRLTPDDAVPYANRGMHYGAKRNLDRAIQDFDKALALKPDLVEALRNRGIARRMKGDYGGAIQDFDDAIRLEPGSSLVLQNRGAVYALKKEYRRAIQDFDQAIAFDPNNAIAFYERCWTAAADGQALETALADCDHAVTLRPKDLAPLRMRALISLKAGKYAQAITDCGTVLNATPKSAPCLYVRGLAKRKQTGGTSGDADIAAALAIKPEVADTYDGLLYLRDG